MGQGDSFIESANNIQGMNEYLGWIQFTSITKDEVFKEILKFKWMAAIILKNSITEYKDLNPLEIARLIKDERARGEQSDEELLQDEIDLIDGIEGTGVQKNTIKDVTFRAISNENRLFINLITINLEMQNKFNKTKPNTISRAVYYAASGLRATVAAGDTDYANMHKVYTIWLCAENVVFDNGFDTAWLYKEKGVNYLYKHRFGIRRFYDELPEGMSQSDREEDLIEIVMIDLKVLKSKVEDKQAGNATADEEVLLESIYNMPKAIGLMEKVYHVDLTSYEKGVSDKMGLMGIIEAQKNELEEQKNELEEQKNELEEQKNELEKQKRVIEEKVSENEYLKKIIEELQSKLQLSQR
ncbi:MAG: hypothetical protein K2M91_06050 [Lachnospiraceae bacterium]|nr:hypothetical protein [Lachnospiraceae bacterium]